MRVFVHTDRCELHGECMVAAPEVFDIGDDDEVVTVLNADPGEHLRTAVEEAVMAGVSGLRRRGRYGSAVILDCRSGGAAPSAAWGCCRLPKLRGSHGPISEALPRAPDKTCA
ncbi:hypothetical protein CG716_22840 [Mycolicibacterium sphagni]|uniref:Ferredoxin n=1 Tax=Mycolicibacterium sphagni TaxID=1786 RepID=A0A255D9V2_9MYCO|nr:hypothetical protein CG716_22840 [Mycolicibacterium sphagni]